MSAAAPRPCSCCAGAGDPAGWQGQPCKLCRGNLLTGKQMLPPCQHHSNGAMSTVMEPPTGHLHMIFWGLLRSQPWTSAGASSVATLHLSNPHAEASSRIPSGAGASFTLTPVQSRSQPVPFPCLVPASALKPAPRAKLPISGRLPWSISWAQQGLTCALRRGSAGWG